MALQGPREVTTMGAQALGGTFLNLSASAVCSARPSCLQACPLGVLQAPVSAAACGGRSVGPGPPAAGAEAVDAGRRDVPPAPPSVLRPVPLASWLIVHRA